jgi:hypothetical protein
VTQGGQSSGGASGFSNESSGARAAAANQQARQAQQAQIDAMAKVRRDVQQAALQRTQQRTVALQSRLAREELIAKSEAKKAARVTAQKKTSSLASSALAATDKP